MQLTKIIVKCMFVFVLCSCAAKPVDPSEIPEESQRDLAQTKWVFKQHGIVLNFESDAELNKYDNSPHTLMMCVYQLSSRESFDQLSSTKSGIEKLLNCENYDPSVVMVNRHIIQPKNNITMTMDRQENTKFVGMVGGFYNLNQSRAVILKAIPLVENSDGLLWWKDRRFSPGVLNLDIELGADGMRINDSKTGN